VPGESARGNIENFAGFAQVPLGLAGPLTVDTSGGELQVVVPMATTEGAMVASYSRGMKAMNTGAGARARVFRERLSQHPVLVYRDAAQALDAARTARELEPRMRELTRSITTHGTLVEVLPEPIGRRLILCLGFETADAIGINMAAHAAELCSALLADETAASERYVHGEDVEKRANSLSFIRGRGRSVVCDVTIPAASLREVLRVAPADLVRIHRTYQLGFARLSTENQLIQSANGLAAVMIACGQDVAYLTECATGFLDFEETENGDLYASAYLPSLLVGTVGGGSGQGTAAECLDLLGVRGDGGANVFAEILAAVVLAGDLSLLASFITHEFVAAHERLGRNRPRS
jgi:hydroxymethylglutaryl-CoA reductase (NADPH)